MMPGEIISTCIIPKDMDTEIELKARVGRKEVKRVGQTTSFQEYALFEHH